MVKNFTEGLITRKQQPHKDIYQETSYLMGVLKTYSHKADSSFNWEIRDQEIAVLKKGITLVQVLETYRRLLLNEDSKRMAIFRTYPEKHHGLAKDTSLDECCRSGKAFGIKLGHYQMY